MVDELVAWPGNRVGPFGAGRESCHLTTDGSIEDLHAFAARIGLRREWFQNHAVPHYDLTPRRREAALAAGAAFVRAREQARARIARRRGGP